MSFTFRAGRITPMGDQCIRRAGRINATQPPAAGHG
jgi:hypothetical protein